ncbi:hypothetical protein QQX98_007078 [Neonectria punicea]|uniref:Amine oxidase domain-containing protein n=1 Tax=Neonectria punicea TaxID=979145 RepID=A0ABR1H085_9HYPO
MAVYITKLSLVAGISALLAGLEKRWVAEAQAPHLERVFTTLAEIDPTDEKVAANLDSITFSEYVDRISDDEVIRSMGKMISRGLMGIEADVASALWLVNYIQRGTGIENLISDLKHGGQHLRIRQEDGQYSLTAFFVGNIGHKWSLKSKEERKRSGWEHLKKMYGHVVSSIPEPIKVIEKEWTKDPWVMGGVVPGMLVGAITSHVGQSLITPHHNIHFVGSETSTEWMGFVEGALRSGRREANEVLLFNYNLVKLSSRILEYLNLNALLASSTMNAAVLFACLSGLASATSLYSSYSFNPLEHLGGVAPYFEPQDPPTSPAAPQGCTAVKAAYLSRHAAIYSNDFDYEEYIEPFISKVENHTGIDWTRVPSLNFLADWTAPISDAEQELLTRVGKHEASQLGVSLSFRYPNLKLPSRVWTSSAERTFDSARALVRGFETDEDEINVVSIYESEESGADSLTPYKACPAYSSSYGSEQSSVYLDIFTKPIMARLNHLAPKFNFTKTDVYGMMQLCGYETVIRGSSPFCDLDLFSPDDWLAWEYTADLMYHYNVGYGNNISGPIGLPWLNATGRQLMNDSGEDLYISFTHRELPPTVLVAMGIFNNSAFGGSQSSEMPLDRINHRRAWKSSHVMPFSSNIAIERLNCSGSFGFDDGDYYRVLVNSAPQPLPDCVDGPGTSCSKDGFEKYLQARTDMFEGFSDKCGVEYKNSTDVLTIYEDTKSENGTSVG